MKIKIKIKPNLPIERYLCIAWNGKKEASIFEPSRGGIGIKLKIARNIFIYIVFMNNWLKIVKTLKPILPLSISPPDILITR